jgi:hypothetical protein
MEAADGLEPSKTSFADWHLSICAPASLTNEQPLVPVFWSSFGAGQRRPETRKRNQNNDLD